MTQVRKATKSIDQTTLTITFSDGKVLTASLPDFNDDIKTSLAMHGLSQKLGDSYAGAETAAEAFGSAKTVLDDLLAGNWSTRRASEGGVRTTVLAEALAALATAQLGRTVSVPEAVEILADMSDEQKAALRKDPGIKLEMARIKQAKAEAEAAKATSSIASLFGGAA